MESVDTTDTLAYAKKKLELARLDEADVSPVFQSLVTTENPENWILMQLNKDVLSHLSEGQDLIIRGDTSETAVLCTDSRTYELKEAETSNSLLLIQDMHWPENDESNQQTCINTNICSIFHTYLELRNMNPSFKKLKSLLEENTYKGEEHENLSKKSYTIDELLDVIQSSTEELEKALNNLHVCYIDGKVRILDFDYKFNVLSQIVDEIETNLHSFNRFPKDYIIHSLKNLVPRQIIDKCLEWYTYEINENDEHGNKLYALNEDKICRLYAEVLLRAAGKFHLAEFLESWQKSVPDGMKCNLEQLQGLALTDMNYRPGVIFHFPTNEMPENIADRFTKLFKVKEKWSYNEIVPYLEDKAVQGNDVKSLLIKFTRESMKDGVKYYSSKW